MTIYSFFLFDRNSTCLFSYHPVPSHQPNKKNIYGLLYTLSNAAVQLGGGGISQSSAGSASTHDMSSRSHSATNESKQEKFLSYQTSFYNLHYYESPTKLKFVCFTSRGDNVLNKAKEAMSSEYHYSSSSSSLNQSAMKGYMKALYGKFCEWVRYGDYEWGEEIEDDEWRNIVESNLRTWNV